MPIHAPNLLVYCAMVFDGPTTLGLRPQNENLHLEACSVWCGATGKLVPGTPPPQTGLPGTHPVEV